MGVFGKDGHSFNNRFKMKVVNDNIEYLDESDKRKGYNLKHGENTYKTGLVNEVTARAGRKWSKKSSREVSSDKGKLLFSVLFKSVTVE